MKQLQSLDLSMNQLTGPIPPSLGSLTFIIWLNVSYNNLSGPIPTGPQLQTINDPSMYSGNKWLCGPPLSRKCSTGNTLDTPDEHKNSDRPRNILIISSSIILGFIFGFWCVIGFLALNKSWRSRYFYFIDHVQSRCLTLNIK
ncbi:hypothetical protein LUZ61_002942 [Rhynchospora tenuis]|uniref:Uncharacterized protein n=1 Tax=Rhynchospora tenuis TaxID=198213 RepID=A0AAD6ES76_9POAL|nr:hypothetical protein LUZ61_002942 [Rhynchospora tenuis]